MPGRHEPNPRTLPGRRALAAVLAALVAVATLLFSAGTAGAASKTYDAQLSLSGIADENNPTGGSQIGIRPGDKVTFAASPVPTAGLKKLGLSNLLGDLLGGITGYQVKADLSKLPGGSKVTLKGTTKKTLTFNSVGTYTFTWTAQRLALLGVVPINLDGNQLKKAGVELNAENEYVGKIVVAKNPPKGGISIQLPKVSVSPKAGPIQLPKVGLPGVNLPTVPVPSLPNLNLPSLGGGKKSSEPAKSSSSTNGYELPGLSIPDQVVPNGDGAAAGGGGGGGAGAGGYQQNANTGTGVFNGALPSVGGTSKAAATSGGSKAAAAPNGQKTVELAADAGSPSSQVPVILAILAIIALALVAGTYARLFLLKQKPTA